MNEKEAPPLSAACVKGLTDKLYEKRKIAALEVEKLIRDSWTSGNVEMVERIVKSLSRDFTLSHNPNYKKGGLIGLAAAAVALGKDSGSYVAEFVRPVMTCMKDSDSRVRYYACESLYNIAKVTRTGILPFFNEMFDLLAHLCTDTDQNVRIGVELLDRLIKDVATETPAFSTAAFVTHLRDKIFTKAPLGRQFAVSWVTFLHAVPTIDLTPYLPELVDGLFLILSDPNSEIRKLAEVALGELLDDIHKSHANVNFELMVNEILVHTNSYDELTQYTALIWLKDFVLLSQETMIPFTSKILESIFRCLAYSDDARKGSKEIARQINGAMMKLVSEYAKTWKMKKEEGGQVEEMVPLLLQTESIIKVLQTFVDHESLSTRLSVLRWMYHLFIEISDEMFRFIEELFSCLLKRLCDSSDEIVLLVLEILSEISSNPAGNRTSKDAKDDAQTNAVPAEHLLPSMNPYFKQFMMSLSSTFNSDRQLLDERGSMIIRQLCLLLHPHAIYQTFGQLLLEENDVEFAAKMVQYLNTILMTSSELFDLRNQLKDLETEESCSLFCCLYKTWCHQPVAAVSLCLLSQNYEHTSALLQEMIDIEVTVNFLIEVDELVQLIESPIFTYLRLQLLQNDNEFLLKSLYGLLMLLPQSEAFHKLKHRLECVPTYMNQMGARAKKDVEADDLRKKIDFNLLLEHFRNLQAKHRICKKKQRVTETTVSWK